MHTFAASVGIEKPTAAGALLAIVVAAALALALAVRPLVPPRCWRNPTPPRRPKERAGKGFALGRIIHNEKSAIFRNVSQRPDGNS